MQLPQHAHLMHRCQYYGVAALAFSYAMFTTRVQGSPLLGNVGVVQSTPIGTGHNPGNYGYVSSTQIESEGGLKQSTANFRVPGSETMKKSASGISLGNIPSYVVKLTPDVGMNVMGFALPGKAKAGLEDIPLLLLDQINRVDVNVTLSSLTFVRAGGGVKIKDRFGVGALVTSVQASGEADIKASGSSSTLAKVAFNGLNATTLRIGARADLVPGKFTVGIATNAVSSTKISKMTLESPLADALNEDAESQGPEEAPDNLSSAFGSGTAAFSEILFGSGLALGKVVGFADFEYKRKAPKQKILSFSKLKVAEGDFHDTMSFKGGGKIKLPRFFSPRGTALSLIGGVEYAKTDLGPGENGQDGKAGFSPLMLVASNFSSGLLSMVGDMGDVLPLGFGAPVPYWSLGGGFEVQTLKNRSRTKGATKYHLVLSGGSFYRVESIGVDEKGDHPFAFEKKTIGLAGSLIYRF